jgi:DNA (cytosine-5)-methyltransferase 1
VTYNENDPFTAEWLRNLITARHLPEGKVDGRSIHELQAEDCSATSHFFAGIGGWPLALRLAGWPDDRAVWTGSCPCQPFSVAGKRTGTDDARHLWPEWFRLIRERRPPVIFGEQVANGDGLAWLDVVQSDLETEGYAVAALDLCAAGFGAPHIRQRLYFVAHATDADGRPGVGGEKEGTGADRERGRGPASGSRVSELGESSGAGREGRESQSAGNEQPTTERAGPVGELGDAEHALPPRRESKRGPSTHGEREANRPDASGATNGFWSDAEWLPCTDGKTRPTQPGIFPLAHGVPGRVGRLRAYGNAVVVPQAAAFVKAYMETRRAG